MSLLKRLKVPAIVLAGLVSVGLLALGGNTLISERAQAQAPPPATVVSIEQYDALVAEKNALNARLTAVEAHQNNTTPRRVYVGDVEQVYHDKTLFTSNDNPNQDYPDFIEDCGSEQVGGSRNVFRFKDTVVNDLCVGGGQFYRRVGVNEGDDPPEITLKRLSCNDSLDYNDVANTHNASAGCNMGFLSWLFANNQANPVQVSRIFGVAAANPVNIPGNSNTTLPMYGRWEITDLNGVQRPGILVNPGGGLTLPKAGHIPQCELPGLSNSFQGATLFWDATDSKLKLQLPYPNCTIKELAIAQ